MEIYHDDIIRGAVGGTDVSIWELADFERAAANMTVEPVMWLWGLQCRPWWQTLYEYDSRAIRRGDPDSTPAKIIAMPGSAQRDALAAAWMRRLRTTIREIMQEYRTWPDVQRANQVNPPQQQTPLLSWAGIWSALVAVLGLLWTALLCALKLAFGIALALLHLLAGVLSIISGGKRKRRR